jgi:hypothetical protein
MGRVRSITLEIGVVKLLERAIALHRFPAQRG